MAAEAFRLAVRATPRGGRDAVEDWGRGPAGRPFLKVRVSAAAADGEANAALIVVLAKALGTPRSNLRIASGATARLKIIEIAGATAADISRAFGAAPAVPEP